MAWASYDPFSSHTLQRRGARPRVRVRPLVPELGNVVPPIADARRAAMYRIAGLGSVLGQIVGTSIVVEHVTGGAGMDVLAVEGGAT